VILACAADISTLETCAATWLLRRHVPELKVRVINVVDLFVLTSPEDHPHGMSDDAFGGLFTTDLPVIFAYHGYPWVTHGAIHHRPNTARFHVHGYREERTTTTPFDMVVLNQLSRFHWAMDALR
jgi:xylulose-5-phosphate/fructose-6-phosphate phosphoketolase